MILKKIFWCIYLKKMANIVLLTNPCIYISEIGDGKYNYTSLLNNLGDVNPELFGRSTKRCNPASVLRTH